MGLLGSPDVGKMEKKKNIKGLIKALSKKKTGTWRGRLPQRWVKSATIGP